MSPLFDPVADAYDRWYDTPSGGAVLGAEVACLRSLCPEGFGNWLEVGVGTGRFASALGIADGVDPSPAMRAFAARRGVRVHAGSGEELPFPAATFDGALLALTLCFVDDPARVLAECRRVLRPGGRLLVGIVPSDSPWGRAYAAKAAAGHALYAHARFRTAPETSALAEGAGLVFRRAASALFWEPGGVPETPARVLPGIVPEAGFVGLLHEAPHAGGGAPA
jgi:SAM-dependent methyltransferase